MISAGLLESQYKDRRILVTGHTGFKGSWLIYWLNRLGAKVRGFALAPEKGHLFDLLAGDTLCESIQGDIRDFEAMRQAVVEYRPHYAFHLAAQSLVGESYASPRETFEVNVAGTVNFLESLRSLPSACSSVVITTDKVYENLETGRPFSIGDKLGGHDPYSASKACTELVCDSYRRSFFTAGGSNSHGIHVATARAGNVIGGGDWNRNHLVPDIVRALSSEDEVVVRNPGSVRPWQHVLEPLAGYLMLAVRLAKEPSAFGRAWNFGPDLLANVTVESFVKQAIRIWGSGDYRCAAVEGAPHEAGQLRLDISETTRHLGWGPVFDIDEAIRRTLGWYQGLEEGVSARDLVESDINEYVTASLRRADRHVEKASE